MHVSLNANKLLLTPPLSSVFCVFGGALPLKNKTNPLRPQLLRFKERMKTLMFTFTFNYKTPALLTRHCGRYNCLNERGENGGQRTTG